MAELRKRGIVAAVVCSEPFAGLGRHQAKILGTPDLPLIVITHPLGGISADEVEQRAAQALPQLLKHVRENAS